MNKMRIWKHTWIYKYQSEIDQSYNIEIVNKKFRFHFWKDDKENGWSFCSKKHGAFGRLWPPNLMGKY
jgi:hypothetical protein